MGEPGRRVGAEGRRRLSGEETRHGGGILGGM